MMNARTATSSFPPSAAGRYVGQSVKRREDPRLLTGHGRYVDDIQLPGMLHATFVRSNHARGTIISVDTTEALKVPGVEAIYTAADLNPLGQQFWHTMLGPPIEMGGQTLYPPGSVLAEGIVRYVGDPIAIVVATSRYIAEDAADLVEVDIDPLPPVLDVRTALADATNLVHPELASNSTSDMPMPEIPSLEEAFANAAHVVSRTFIEARCANVPMEPRGLIVKHDPYAGDLQIWVATQSVHEVKAHAARLTGVPESHVRVIANDVGGGFGLKMMSTRDESAIMVAGFKLAGPPLKWIEDRRENLFAANQARSEEIETSMAFDADGKILGAKVHFIEEVGAYPAGGGATGSLAMGIYPGPYRISMLAPASTAAFTNTVGKQAYRGPWAMETIAREQLLDCAARVIGIEPLELRRRNIIQQADLPYTTATMLEYDHISPSETLDQAAEMIGVETFRAEQAAARAEGRLIGLGMSVYTEPSAIAFGILSSDVAILKMDISGKVQVAMGTGNHGHSLETTIPQIVAEHLGCDIDDVVLVQGDTHTSPTGPGTGGSRSAVIAGGAAQTAAVELKDKLIKIAAQLLEANPDDLEVANSVVSVKGTSQAAIPFAALAMTALMAPDMLPEGVEVGLEVSARFRPPGQFTWSNASHACIVEVDAETGIVKILRYVVSEDCGRMINPMVVDGQIAGGVVQGIGNVLFEHMAYDDAGNPLATSFMDYLLPSAPEIPDFEFGHIETLSASLGGYKGMGEGGAIGAPPAVANAVNDALAHLGVELTEFPFGPNRVLEAIINAGDR